MPVLIIYGMPAVNEAGLSYLARQLQEVVAGIKTLGIFSSDVSVFFPMDRMNTGLGEEIICFVEGMFVKPERTTEVRQQLAVTVRNHLVSMARDGLPQCQRIEVFVKQFNPEKDGFAAANPQEK